MLIHKIGDTLANLTLRLLFDDLGYTNDEIAFYDVFIGFIAFLVGIFVGGAMYARFGMKRAVLVSLVLMAVSNFSFAALAAAGHCNLGMAGAIGFENFASGIGGVTVVAYLSALCNLRFTATQYALAVGAGKHRRPFPHWHDGGGVDRSDGLRELLPAHHGDCVPGRHPVLVHDSHRGWRTCRLDRRGGQIVELTDLSNRRTAERNLELGTAERAVPNPPVLMFPSSWIPFFVLRSFPSAGERARRRSSQ